MNDSAKEEYATLAGNYTPVDGTMFFLPRNGASSINTGYVSKEVSNADRKFSTNPVITVTMEAIRAYYGLELVSEILSRLRLPFAHTTTAIL